MRRLAPLALLLSGCHAVVVVAELADLSSGTSAANDLSSGTSSSNDLSSGTADPPCTPPVMTPCDGAFDPLRALGLGCPGDPAPEQVALLSPEPGAARTARQFANAVWTARAGEQLLALSTGFLPPPDVTGRITVPAGAAVPGTDNQNPDGAPPPAPVDADALGGRWQTDQAHDLVALRFDLPVPEDIRGFTLDLAFLSAEYPRRADLAVGDALVVWVTGEAYTGDLAGLGVPVGATALRGAIAEGGLVGVAPALVDTGFDGLDAEPCDLGWASYPQCPRGGALAWSPLRGPATPGELLQVVVALADQGDATRDTVVLLDAWRWTCDDCTRDNDCGLAPAP